MTTEPTAPSKKRPPRRANRGGRQTRGNQYQGPQGERNNGNRSKQTVIGVSGLKHLAGRVNEEYLNALKLWGTEVKLYLEMRDDTLIGTLLDAIKAPLLAANFDTEPGGEATPADEEASDWLYQVLNGMNRQTWVSHAEDALEAIEFGFSIHAMNLDKRADGRIWLANLEPRGQETLYQWGFSEDGKGDEVEMFRQQDPNGTGLIFDVPMNQCIHIRFRGRKGNPQGRSLLRSIYRSYKFMRNLEDLEAIGSKLPHHLGPFVTLRK